MPALTVRKPLPDLQLFAWYFDSHNYIQNIRSTYARLLGFPLRYIVPSQVRRAARARLRLREVEVIDAEPGKAAQTTSERVLLESGWHRMYGLARECYKTLQTRLLENSGSYFFGNRPT